MFAKKFQRIDKINIFEKPVTMPFQICKKYCKIINNLMCNIEKLKMCKFLLTGCMQIICKNFFAKLVQADSMTQAVRTFQQLQTITF